MAQNSELIVIRHGDTGYTDEFPDITDVGQQQISQTASQLAEHVAGFDCVVALSSPAVRAQGSAHHFLEAIGRQDVRVRTIGALANFGVLDMDAFLEYMAEHSTSIYGELWLTDEILAGENPITESREAVEHRARGFLMRYARAIDRIGKAHNLAICALVFTHFEIGNEFLKGALTPGEFPIKRHPVQRHAEPVIIELERPDEGIFTVRARGRSRRARFDPQTGQFKRTRAKKTDA